MIPFVAANGIDLVFADILWIIAVGVLHGGHFYVGAVGITNVDHPLPVTPQTLFQIGSTSKTFTATALMQLVDEGRVDLNATVRIPSDCCSRKPAPRNSQCAISSPSHR
jgi:CubicO group peptidase (beta-lactamase class C family)